MSTTTLTQSRDPIFILTLYNMKARGLKYKIKEVKTL